MKLVMFVSMICQLAIGAVASEVLVEAEQFAEKGGWVVDPQFIESIGSPYLLAHGMGVPVADARTSVDFPNPGTYRVWVRTKNWVPGPWEAPGRFKVSVNGQVLTTVFGTESGWGWQDGGEVEISDLTVHLTLCDMTGFAGRCDAIYFTTDTKAAPPNDSEELALWRNRLSGIEPNPSVIVNCDLVVVGGGIAGCAAAVAAGEQGMNVVLIHDRPVFGGNASQEVRVHTLGIYGAGRRILEKLDTEHWPNGSNRAINDDKKRDEFMRNAMNVQSFLSYRAYSVKMEGSRILSVDARHIETGQTIRFSAPLFIDCTGDGWIGFWAGADYRYGRESHHEFSEGWDRYGDLWSPEKPDNRVLGSTILWNSKEGGPSAFPEVPWAMDVAKNHVALRGTWHWEYSCDELHQINDAEQIRDHMFRAIYGSFSNAKKISQHKDMELSWVGYIVGKRESRRLIGDYIYTQNDVLERRRFPDEVVMETRAIDVHYQQKYKGSSEDFLSEAIFRKADGPYFIPFRSFYSRNIENLMMAGRCFSCSHIGLSGPRVMRTTGQMGIATGYAAALCRKYDLTPREVGRRHIGELRNLIDAGK